MRPVVRQRLESDRAAHIEGQETARQWCSRDGSSSRGTGPRGRAEEARGGGGGREKGTGNM
jgi:hypothetical protein